MDKADRKGFFKDNIKNVTKDWPRGSYLVLKIKYTVTRDSPLISIGYTYNAQKVLSFINTEGTGITKADIFYLSK